MGDLFPIYAKIIPIDGNSRSISAPLIQKLSQFTTQHYHIENTSAFIDNVLKPQQMGELIIFSGEADELVGFTRIYQQQLELKGIPIKIYSTITYNNQTHNTSIAGARLGLTRTMKYKLSHPGEELVHFASVSTASKYQFLTRISNTIYPRPNSDVPEEILRLAKILKESNNWPSSATHPMVIGGQLLKKQQLPAETATDDPLTNYYLSLNPDGAQGKALLVCIPLNIRNIGYGIRQLLTQASPDHLNQLANAGV